MQIKKVIFALALAVMTATSFGGTPRMAPDESFVNGGNGRTTMCPDGTFVGGSTCVITPNGKFVGR